MTLYWSSWSISFDHHCDHYCHLANNSNPQSKIKQVQHDGNPWPCKQLCFATPSNQRERLTAYPSERSTVKACQGCGSLNLWVHTAWAELSTTPAYLRPQPWWHGRPYHAWMWPIFTIMCFLEWPSPSPISLAGSRRHRLGHLYSLGFALLCCFQFSFRSKFMRRGKMRKEEKLRRWKPVGTK